MKKGILLIDVARCHGCNNCFMACKDEFVGNSFPPYSLPQPRHGQQWIRLEKTERGEYPMIDISYVPIPCQHCQDAPCQKAGGEAVVRLDSGAVVFHSIAARGNKALADACPYRAAAWNEEEQIAQKCNLCSHLLAASWEKPRCVMACPTEALTFHWMEDADLPAFVESHKAQVLHPELHTRPRVYYKNLHRALAHFIGGSLTLDGECLEGAVVSCRDKDGALLRTARSNAYGDFKLDGLEPGTYTLSAEYPGCEPLERTCTVTDQSLVLGELPCTPLPSAADRRSL